MLCGYEGNRRSGVALVMRHRLSSVPTYGLSGLGKGHDMNNPPSYAAMEYSTFPLLHSFIHSFIYYALIK